MNKFDLTVMEKCLLIDLTNDSAETHSPSMLYQKSGEDFAVIFPARPPGSSRMGFAGGSGKPYPG